MTSLMTTAFRLPSVSLLFSSRKCVRVIWLPFRVKRFSGSNVGSVYVWLLLFNRLLCIGSDSLRIYGVQSIGITFLILCDFCLSFFINKNEFKRHTKKCTQRHPPGDEFYRDKDIAFFEVNGSSSKIYCENLSYISRMFLDHKNVNNTIEGFFFYVLCDV